MTDEGLKIAEKVVSVARIAQIRVERDLRLAKTSNTGEFER